MALWLNSIHLSKAQLGAFGAFAFLFALSWTLPAYVGGAGLASCVAEALLLFVPVFFLILVAVKAIQVMRSAAAERAVKEACPSGGGSKDERSFFLRHRLFLGVLAVTLVVWGAVFVVCFPGITSKDTMDILNMVMGGGPVSDRSFRYDGLNDHHPLLYAAVYWMVLKAGALFGASMTTSVALLSLFHLACLALSCAYCASTAYALTRSKAALIFVCLFLTFDPLVALYSITAWKDVLFAAVVLSLVSLSLRMASSPGGYAERPVRLLPFGLLLAACALLRSNGAVVAMVIGVGMVLLMPPDRRRKAVACAGACALAAFLIVKGPAAWALGVQPAHFAEAVALPIQQIGRTVSEGGAIGQEQQDAIERIIPLDAIEEAYDPRSSNGIKFDEQFDDASLEADKAGFLKTWAHVGLSNPGPYLRAWCALTECYWSLNGSTWYFSNVGYDFDQDGSNDAEPLLSAGAKPSHLFAFAGVYLDAFALLFQPAALGWSMLFALLCFWAFRSRAAAFATLSLVAYWLTFFVAAPANDFRYIFPLMVCAPLILVFLIHGRPGSTEGVSG